MKTSFLNHNRPLFTTMILANHPEKCIYTAKNAIYDRTDAFYMQTCYLQREFRTLEQYEKIFEAMEGKPICVASYRGRYNEGLSDEECMDNLLLALKAGATMGDVMGDIYDPSPMELTYQSDAVKKQKDLIDRIHDMGKEVLMSSHVRVFTEASKVLEIALAQQERGVDIVKIVTGARTEEEELENLRITQLLGRELKIPFLFVSGGKSRLHRMIGPALGSCMCLCVQQHDELSAKTQPVLRTAHSVLDNLLL